MKAKLAFYIILLIYNILLTLHNAYYLTIFYHPKNQPLTSSHSPLSTYTLYSTDSSVRMGILLIFVLIFVKILAIQIIKC